MTAPTLGYIATRPDDDPIVVAGTDFSKVGILSTSADADADVFPLNTPIRFSSTDPAYLSKIGTGYLADALQLLNAQLKGLAADVIVVRVAEGASSDPTTKLSQTLANCVGSAGSNTGLYAFLTAAEVVKAVPRLIIVPGYTAQQPDGTGVANPVMAAIGPVLDTLRAFMPYDVAPGSADAAIAGRETMSSMRMMPVGVAVRAYKTVSNVTTLTTMPASPIVAGLFVRQDNNLGGKPFDTICNQPVYGIADVSRPIAFSLIDGSTEGQTMLASDVSIIVSGQSANVDAIAEGGFVFLGWETCDISENWRQAHQVRGQDYIDVEEQKITRKYLGKRITPRVVESWLKSLDFAMLDHVKADPPDILGYKIVFSKDLNSANQVELGMLHIQSYIQQAPIFLVAQNDVRKYRPALDALVATVIANTGNLTATV
ncbi:conserved hypothetical protein [Methylobacterium sp. 4-46]|uniref:hypothetical protein n=1 Tax=unclassified Methylobacterium TaxID=2615210 RepID=UPI000152DF57|nr:MULTISPECIES: hypothetical protein [Methylobacterium]ACA18487.1 conserved hypothetical protein [Methylobacterium sp. 4-46]WFT77775.1 hypothetical protein QA634_20975 [Methylobacterium nodulans]